MLHTGRECGKITGNRARPALCAMALLRLLADQRNSKERLHKSMADKQSCAFRTTIGGQALIEGILMRGPEKQAIVVRGPEGLVIREEELKLIRDKYPILGLPLIRGSVTFLDSMVKGVKALMFSADYYPEEAGVEEPSRFEQWLDRKLGNEKWRSW